MREKKIRKTEKRESHNSLRRTAQDQGIKGKAMNRGRLSGWIGTIQKHRRRLRRARSVWRVAKKVLK